MSTESKSLYWSLSNLFQIDIPLRIDVNGRPSRGFNVRWLLDFHLQFLASDELSCSFPFNPAYTIPNDISRRLKMLALNWLESESLINVWTHRKRPRLYIVRIDVEQFERRRRADATEFCDIHGVPQLNLREWAFRNDRFSPRE